MEPEISLPCSQKSACSPQAISFVYYLSMAQQPLVGPRPLFQFLDLFTQSVGLLRRGIGPSQGRYLRTGQHKQNKSTQTSMPQVRFEPTIPVFERAKTVHALDRAATVIGHLSIIHIILSRFRGAYRRGLDWWMDLLTTYSHDSELQAITALSLIYSLFTNHCSLP
jgi:hypothetical protein